MREENGRDRGRGKRKRKSILRFFGKVFLFLTGLLALMTLLGFFIFIRPELNRLRTIAYDKLASGNLKDLTKRSDTVVLDYAGNTLGTINAGHFVYVTIDQISPNLQNAYIAQEDRKFSCATGKKQRKNKTGRFYHYPTGSQEYVSQFGENLYQKNCGNDFGARTGKKIYQSGYHGDLL